MQGLSATPIMLIVVIMITGFVFLHFMRMDQWTAASITKEAEVHRLQSDTLESTSLMGTSLYIQGIEAARSLKTENELVNYLKGLAGVKDVIINNNDFDVIFTNKYTATLGTASISTTQERTEKIDYPFKRLVDAANGVTIPSGVRCDDANTVVSSINNQYPGIEWNIDINLPGGYDYSSGCCEWGTECNEDGCWQVCKRSWSCTNCIRDYSVYFYTNNMQGLSKNYPHNINEMKTSQCYERICMCGYAPQCY